MLFLQRQDFARQRPADNQSGFHAGCLMGCKASEIAWIWAGVLPQQAPMIRAPAAYALTAYSAISSSPPPGGASKQPSLPLYFSGVPRRQGGGRAPAGGGFFFF